MLQREPETELTQQLGFFANGPALPEGFRYQPDILPARDEQALIARLAALPLVEFDFHGFKGKRRVVSYGWHYDFGARELQPATEI